MKTIKNPFEYKRQKEQNLPFSRASRVIISDRQIYEVLGTEGFPRRGDLLARGQEPREGERGYLDVESVIAVLLREVIALRAQIALQSQINPEEPK
jgi:hypothetical protein